MKNDYVIGVNMTSLRLKICVLKVRFNKITTELMATINMSLIFQWRYLFVNIVSM